MAILNTGNNDFLRPNEAMSPVSRRSLFTITNMTLPPTRRSPEMRNISMPPVVSPKNSPARLNGSSV